MSDDPTQFCAHCGVMVRLDRPSSVWWHVEEVPATSRIRAMYLYCKTTTATPKESR